jgi:SecD/SecF fusion protein
MSSRRRNLFVILLMLGFMVGSVAIIVTKETKLGLDLRGGVELVYQGEPTPQSEVTPEAIDRAIDIMRERVDRLGVAEPEIQRLGNDQISVGLPGVKNLERAKAQVGTTAQLYLYDWERNVLGSPTAPINSLYSAVKRASQRPPQIDEDNTTKQQLYLFRANKTLAAGPDSSRQELLAESGGRVPKGSEVLKVPAGTVVLKAERPEDLADDAPFERYFVVRDNPELRGTDIKDPRQESDQTVGEPIVTFRFTDQGRKNFQEVTRRLAERGQTRQVPGQPVESSFQTFAIVLDRELVSRPFIDYRENPDGIDGRTGAQISGGFKLQEAQDLADVLKTGALPIDLKPISETQVSASLGKQALREGLLAGAVGFGLVLVFLMLFYRLLGVIASFALVTYAVLFYGMIKLIPITLTLPGIAGLILTIGIAADSNIVIFERIKEELRAGRSSLSAIATGYRRGIATIIDANVVTLITAFILFVLATAGVKGFAFTLGVGVLVSLFTAVLFTQAVLSTMGRSKLLRSPAMLGAGERHYEWKFDFMGNSRWFFAMSGMILIIGSLAVATKQLNFGIDFESGTRVTASLERDITVEGVRDAIRPLGLGDAKIQEVENPELGDHVVQISTAELGPGGVQRVERLLDEEFGVTREGLSSESVGPTFGETVARSAAFAIVASLLLIMAYVALRFEPKFAIPVMIALFHDLLITAGVYSLTGREVTTSTVAAILTILGYSLYDVVIVFDRIRENAPRMPRAAFSQIVNRSMSDVLTRSLATSMSTLMGVTAIFLFGGETLKDFAFALLVGIVSGTYSSIFIAAPVLTEWKEREPAFRQRRRRIEADQGYVPAYAATPGGVKADQPAPARRRGRRDEAEISEPAPEPASPVATMPLEPEGDAVPSGGADGTNGAPPYAPDEQPAPVGGDGADAGDREALRAERAERKKQRQQRQRSRRKHGRRR